MRGKLAKLVRKYVEVTNQKDLRVEGTVDRPDYVIRQKIYKMNEPEKIKFIKEMKAEVANDG